MLEELKQNVYIANLELWKNHLVVSTWGNVSGIDREHNLVVIKPSGVQYELLQPSDMVVVDLCTSKVIEGCFRPSSDTLTHLEIYKAFPTIGGITHTHSVNAVAFAQAGMCIPALGTTHADYFYGEIPITRELTKEEIEVNYELNTGKVIVERFKDIDPLSIPSVLVKNHGPFTWGTDPMSSMMNSLYLETIAEMALKSLIINPQCIQISKYMLDVHYFRKHGSNAYYGQSK